MMRLSDVAGLPIWTSALLMIGGAVLVELMARRTLKMSLRDDHTQVASAIFTVIGTTYAVLLAFVAMLAFEGYNRAQATTDVEASLVWNAYRLIDGLDGPEMPSMRNDAIAYARAVVAIEFPVQERGIVMNEEQTSLEHVTRTALHLRPGNIADGNLHALLLDDLTRLSAARRDRLLAARTPIPSIVWAVLLAGGAITVGFTSFLGTPNLWMHLAMSTLLAISGALVLLVIVALSNPFRGEFRVTAEPFVRILVQMAHS